MKQLTKSYVYLSISGNNFDIEEFLSLFQFEPTRIGTHRIGYKFIEYKIEAENIYEGLEEAMNKLKNIFFLKEESIKSYAIQNNLYIKVYVVIFKPKNKDSGAFLSNDIIKFLYNIGAEIEIDVYNR